MANWEAFSEFVGVPIGTIGGFAVEPRDAGLLVLDNATTFEPERRSDVRSALIIVLCLLCSTGICQDPFSQQVEAEKAAAKKAKNEALEAQCQERLNNSLVPDAGILKKMQSREWKNKYDQRLATGRLSRVYHRRGSTVYTGDSSFGGKGCYEIEVSDSTGTTHSISIQELDEDGKKYVEAFVAYAVKKSRQPAPAARIRHSGKKGQSKAGR